VICGPGRPQSNGSDPRSYAIEVREKRRRFSRPAWITSGPSSPCQTPGPGPLPPRLGLAGRCRLARHIKHVAPNGVHGHAVGAHEHDGGPGPR